MGPPGAPFRLGPGAKCPSCPPLWAALTDGVIILERLTNGVEESDLKPRSYNTKSNLVKQVRDRDTLIEQSS